MVGQCKSKHSIHSYILRVGHCFTWHWNELCYWWRRQNVRISIVTQRRSESMINTSHIYQYNNLKMELDDSAIIKYDTLYCLYILNDQLLALNVAFSSKPASSSYVWKLDKYGVNAYALNHSPTQNRHFISQSINSSFRSRAGIW